ncbi:Trypsin Inhibitor-like, cysteine rich domain-containing protein [Strongyloides ratti]|uniref:Trypsin Inhibitor-like, cysteine rich domain-containing protein n=1 Tax=Strongyloides ratti TaxID=34506 RepID=A0A090L4H4_STRRB|nr:Trypsin Inhibitor-like, cysteine rich domain-containing protein [Strongyloides ratti]CEF64617.1 Trypsin Inhibitor-like, cysteine rich domain-containing protein [Strongyloides ratti]
MLSTNFCFLFVLLFLIGNISIKSNPVTTSPKECRENEVYLECGPCNERRCYTIYFFVDPCKFNKCYPPGCYCKDGYGRKSLEDDTCTLLSTCQKNVF